MYVMILNDGTTFTSLTDCRIVDVGAAIDISTDELKKLPSIFDFHENEDAVVMTRIGKCAVLIQ